MVRRSVLTVAFVIALSAVAASTQAFGSADTPATDDAACALIQAVAGAGAIAAP